jgi:hypothetical protein
MDITCKKKSEALAHLNQFWSKFPFLSHYNSVGVLVGDLFAAAAAAAVLQYCVKLFL